MAISSLIVVVVGVGCLKMFGISKEMFQKIPNKITYLATVCFFMRFEELNEFLYQDFVEVNGGFRTLYKITLLQK